VGNQQLSIHIKRLLNYLKSSDFFARESCSRAVIPLPKNLSRKIARFLVSKIGPATGVRWGWVFFKSRLHNDVRRSGRVLAGLFSQQILSNTIQRCSNQHAENFIDETNMRRFESVFTNRITTNGHHKSKISKRIVLFDNILLIQVTQISFSLHAETV